MSDVRLDLKDFKHVSTDEHTTTLQHKTSKHTIRLYHNALSKVAQQQLGALKHVATDAQTVEDKNELADKTRSTAAEPKSREDKGYGAIQMKAEGGPVSSPAAPQEDSKSKPDTDTNKCYTLRSNRGYGAIIMCDAEGGEVPKPKYCMHCGGPAHEGQYAEGGDVESNDDDLPTTLPEKKVEETNFKDWSPVVETPDSLAKVSDEDPLSLRDIASKSTEGALPVPDASDVASQSTDLKTWSPPGSFVPKEATPNVAGAEQEAAAAQPQPPQPASEQAPGATLPGAGAPNPQDAESMLMGGYNQRLQGVQEQAQAQGALGEEQAKQIDQTVQAQQEAKQAFQQHYNELEQERQAFMHDVQNGQIDPNKYWTGDANGNGGHSRIAAGIGMILAGFNPTNRPNAAIDYVKSQMEMNLKAQERNLSSKENLVNANLRQFGNLKDATDMTRIMQHDMLSNELASAAAKSQTPMSKALALDAAGKIKMDTAPLVQQFAMRRALMNLSQNGGSSEAARNQMLDYMEAVNPGSSKSYRERIIPGVPGMASVPIPDSTRATITSYKNVNDLFNRSLEFSKMHKGSLSPSVRAQAATIQNQLIGTIKQAQHDGVYKPSEAEFLLSQIGNSPASFLSGISSVPKIKELQQIKQQEYNQELSKVGLKPQALPGANDNEPIKGKDGRMYKKSADGKFMIPVGK